MDEYKKWCTDSYFDKETQEELKVEADNPKEIENQFYCTLDFSQVDLGVVIVHDSKVMHNEFAEESTLCFVINGIKTVVFRSLCLTLELSFVLRELGCIAGVVLTTSHNSRGYYNGYKVYWEGGGQITPLHNKNVLA